MADTFTANYNLTKPEIGASRDSWGSKVNANLDKIDAQIKGNADAAAAANAAAGAAQTTANAAVKRAGDVMTGGLTAPMLQVNGTDGSAGLWLLSRNAGDNYMLLNQNNQFQIYDTAKGYTVFLVDANGGVNTRQLGDLKTYIDTGDNSAQANANGRVSKSGDTMTGKLNVYKGDADISLTQNGGAYNGYEWHLMNFSGDGRLYFQDYQGGVYKGNPVHFGRDGSITTAQLGDLSTRIETRAAAFADDRLATARAEYGQKVAKAGDTMTGNLVINRSVGYPGLQFYWYGVLSGGWLLDSDARIKWRNYDSGEVYFSIGTGGDVWTKQFGDVKSYVDSQANWAAGTRGDRVYKGGDTMSGDLTVSKAWPQLKMSYPGVTNMGWQLSDSARLAWVNYDTGGTMFSIGSGGDIATSQLGDLNNRIESRGQAWADSRLGIARAEYGSPVQRTGDSMSGDLTIGSKQYPQMQLLWGGVLRAGWMLDSNGSAMWRNADNGAVYMRIRTDGGIETAQFGDLNQRIEDRAYSWADAKKGEAINACVTSARWVYAGQKNCNEQPGTGGFIEPAGAHAMSCGYWTWIPNDGSGAGAPFSYRWRVLQIYIANQGWVTVGAAS